MTTPDRHARPSHGEADGFSDSPSCPPPHALRLRHVRLGDLPMAARLLVAVPRLRGRARGVAPLERCVLDTFGRVLDASPARERTIDAANELAATLLGGARYRLEIESAPRAWLTHDEIVIADALAALARGPSDDGLGRLERLMDGASCRRFAAAARELMRADAFAVLGRHAFTPRALRTGVVDASPRIEHRSVVACAELGTDESVLLNAARLWVRGVVRRFDSVRALRTLAAHLALPGLEGTLHAVLHETALHARHRFDVRCLCCPEISPDEARLLATLAAFGVGDVESGREHLREWLPRASVESLLLRATEARDALGGLDAPVPCRRWDFGLLRERQALFADDGHRVDARTVH